MSFQDDVGVWMHRCFGSKISKDQTERNHRFLEEALELVQAFECTADEAHQLVDYVFNRPMGDKYQEIGGVMVTLAALCEAAEYDMDDCGRIELTRIWSDMRKIRAKQAAKPKHSPLPEPPLFPCGDFYGMASQERGCTAMLAKPCSGCMFNQPKVGLSRLL